MNKEDAQFKDYYKTVWWKNLVKKLLEPMTTKCELCGANRWKLTRKKEKKINRVFTVHHKHYNTLHKEKREDVQLLCRRCHNLAHDILRMHDETKFVEDLKEVVRNYFTYDGGYNK